MTSALPKVSVVTINYNMGEELETTLQSVLDQTYPNLEYVIIDGGSKDRSGEVIRNYADRVAYWVSERDAGRYDAMNKGVRAATGEWVLFMNAGDQFHDKEVLADVFANTHDDADLVYGHHVKRYLKEGVTRVIRGESPDVLHLRMNCSHQSLFARHSLLLAHPFLTTLSIAADHNFLVESKVAGARFKMVDRVISVFWTGGASDQRRFQSWKERRWVVKRQGWMTFGLSMVYLGIIARALVGPYMKAVLPSGLTRWLLRHKNYD